ncbi:hypothetical protein DFH09DRAFT_1111118 [Mycena vulgaris]|nr:hypothetical protein DFH09DRAFT_1111118 [Mycena vulgaris]
MSSGPDNKVPRNEGCSLLQLSLLVFQPPQAQRQKITGTIPGFPRPTSTNSTIVNAYGNAVQKCGADVDAALQGALSPYQDAVGIDDPNLNITDAGFLQWAHLNWTPFITASVECQNAENAVDAVVDEDPKSSTPTGAVSSTAAPGTTEPSPASATAPSSGSGSSASPAPSLSGGAIGHGTPPVVVIASLMWLLVGLN